MGQNDFQFDDASLPLSLERRAAAVLSDIGSAMPYDGGDALQALTRELVDEFSDLQEVIRLLVAGEHLLAGDKVRGLAVRYSYQSVRS